jgi:hypothetical protein
MAERQPALVTPFWVRIATETNLSPGWLLIVFPAVLYPTYLLLEVLFGRGLAAATDFWGDLEAWMVLFHATALGYLVMMGVYVALATVVFLFPVRGLRRQIRDRKAAELAKVRDQVHVSKELADGSGTQSVEAGAKLPGLLAYKHEIESVREWPFDAPTLTRFFLYVAIPLGSWIGGALVERLLGAALD